MGTIGFLYKNFENSIKKDLSTTLGLNLSKPMQVIIQPNERCNAKCIMCDCWHEKNDYINSEEIIDALKQLRDWVGTNFFVQIAGGEPLIYKGIFDIFKFCSDNGIVCKISTNGIALNEKICDKIIESKLPYLSVSMDSHIPAIHDKYRGVPGTLEKGINGIKYLAKNGNLTLGISSVLMKENVETFPETIEYFLSLPIHRLLIQPIRIWTDDLPIERWPEYQYWVNDTEALNRVTSYLIEKKQTEKRLFNSEKDIQEWHQYFTNPQSIANKETKVCKIGYDHLNISYKGDITMGCGRFSTIGNIKEGPIKEAWDSKKATAIRTQMMKCHHPCTSNCYKDLTLQEKISKAKVFIKSGLFKKN